MNDKFLNKKNIVLIIIIIIIVTFIILSQVVSSFSDTRKDAFKIEASNIIDKAKKYFESNDIESDGFCKLQNKYCVTVDKLIKDGAYVANSDNSYIGKVEYDVFNQQYVLFLQKGAEYYIEGKHFTDYKKEKINSIEEGSWEDKNNTYTVCNCY